MTNFKDEKRRKDKSNYDTMDMMCMVSNKKYKNLKLKFNIDIWNL